MDDLISRQEALSFPFANGQYDNENANEHFIFGCEAYREWLEQLPSAQKKGQWVYDAEAYPLGNPYGHYDCDQCGESVPRKTNFCPNCGADMRGEDDG